MGIRLPELDHEFSATSSPWHGHAMSEPISPSGSGSPGAPCDPLRRAPEAMTLWRLIEKDRPMAHFMNELRSCRTVEERIHAAERLADAGAAVVGGILDALGANPMRDQSFYLLKALSWIDVPEELRNHYARASVPMIGRFLAHADASVREAAAQACAILPAGEACSLLRAALPHEPVSAVREIVEDELRMRQDG